jgi:hypothetical protein
MRPKPPYRFWRLLANIPTAINKIMSNHHLFFSSSWDCQYLSNWDFPTQNPISQRRSYSCDKDSTRQTNQDVSHLVTKFSRSVIIIKSVLPGNYSQYHVVCIRKRNVCVFFHIQGLFIFASILFDFRQSIRPVWIIDFSFPCIWCPDSVYLSDMPCCTIGIDIYIFPRSW